MKKCYLYALICYAVASAMALIRLFDSVHQHDRAKMAGSGIWLFLSIATFICLLLLYKRQVKTIIAVHKSFFPHSLYLQTTIRLYPCKHSGKQ